MTAGRRRWRRYGWHRAVRRGSRPCRGTRWPRPGALLDGIRTVAAGESLLSPVATRALIGHLLDRATPTTVDTSTLRDLTPREREVVALVAQGLSNEQIAEQLYLSPLTAKTHVNRAMTKLGARDRAQLVVFAYQAGLGAG